MFSYLLAITEINTYLALKHFDFNEGPNTLHKLLNFCCELALQMIDNSLLKDAAKNVDSEKAMSTDNIHKYAVAPHHARYFNSRVWVLGTSYKYKQYQCSWPDCKKRCNHIAYATQVFGCVLAATSNTVLNVF